MIKFIKNIYNNFRLSYLDIKNKKQFKKDIEGEEKDPKSKFNYFHLNKSKDELTISVLVNIPENFVVYKDERLINMKIRELIDPVTKYLSYELGWAEYLIVPEIFHIEDEDESEDNESLTYMAVWKWEEIKGGWKYFMKCAGSIIIIAGMIFSVLKLLI